MEALLSLGSDAKVTEILTSNADKEPQLTDGNLSKALARKNACQAREELHSPSIPLQPSHLG